jgi:hypothetical protein
MTDNSQNFDNLQERNQQVLTNITQLQTQEKQLYNSLDNANLSSEQKKLIINQINEISQMRLNMYGNLKDMYSYYQTNVSAATTTLGQEMYAIDVLENELNETKIRMNLLEEQKYNKLRLVEINTYYGKQYNTHTKIMQTIVLMCVPIFILSILANNGIIPSILYGVITGIIIVIGIIMIGWQIIDISNRDNMNWDEYNWDFDKSKAPVYTPDGSETNSDPWAIPSLTCIGADCCYSDSTYDSVQNICVPTTGKTTGSTTTATTTGSTTTATTTGSTTTATTGTKEAFTGLSKYGFFSVKQ